MRGQDYKSDLLEDLRKDRKYAAAYLAAAGRDSQEALLVALRDVTEALKGIGPVAAETGVNRENLYRALSRAGNPRLSTLGSVLSALGMSLSVNLKQSSDERPAKRIQKRGEIIATTSDRLKKQRRRGEVRAPRRRLS
jgi:probable addiction module antidote protein